MPSLDSPQLPISQKWLVDGFCWYGKRMLRKRFASVGVRNAERLSTVPKTMGLVVYINHASWWDPIVGMLLKQQFAPERTLYAPIDAEQLENYAILKKMGFFGVELQSFWGAQNFLLTSKAIVSSPNASLWLTPEGRFCDVRDQSQPLMPGLSHLASRTTQVVFLPVALEYAFWDDALPQIFCNFGASICSESPPESRASNSKSDWNSRLTEGLRNTQMELAELVKCRDPKAFDYMMASKAQRLSWYDYARSWIAWGKGRPFDPRHSELIRSTKVKRESNRES